MKFTNCLFIGAALAVLPVFAFATPVTLENPTANFQNATGGSGVSYNNGTGHSEIHWGTPTSKNPGKKSGLGFTVFASPFNTHTGDTFDLGELFHYNWEVKNGTAISAVDLAFGFSITDPNIGPLNYVFPITIDETNNSSPCAESPDPAGNYCPDIITFSNATDTQMFDIAGVEYTLYLLGFGQDADSIQNEFITQESQTNSTHLWAKIDAATPPVNVPEPSALFLMALGLFALGGVVQLREKQNKA